jgi:transcriptional regulator with XRE-family HTH domain
MSKFNLAELRSWRKKHGLSQSQLAEIAHLGLSTILKLEAGIKVRDRSRDELLKAIEEVESKESSPASKMQDAPKPEADVPAAKSEPQAIQPPKPLGLGQVSNLDLELINRILKMNPKEKLRVLEILIS